jgi:hypothetical protein
MIDFMREALSNTDLYLHPMRIIDTDYDNFLIFYSCRDEQRDPKDEETPLMAHFLMDMKEKFG